MAYAYGIYSGTTDFYYAIMTTEDASNTPAVYGDPKVLGKSVSFSVTPTYKEGEKYASNSAVRREKKINSYEVTLACDAIETETLAEVIGRTVGEDGVQIVKGSDKAPYIALGFGITKDDGNTELWWLFKGKLSREEISGETETGDINYQDIELSGVFDRRINDDAIAAIADTKLGSMTVNTWFNKVYGQT